MLAAALLAACSAAPRRQAPPTTFNPYAPVGFPADVRQVGVDETRTVEAFNQWLTRIPSYGSREPLQVLALPGGGAASAFGAGVLAGMTRMGRRPRYDVVTGTSAGAPLAPFAFLGPAWDSEMAEAFDGDVASGLLRQRGVGSLFHPGVFRGEPLVQLVDRFVTDRMIGAVAAEAAKGRVLLVATTNLDTEETVVWDMGGVAARGGPDARRLFRDVLVESSSIPAVFPPFLIRVGDDGEYFDEMQVDGGTTTPFFVTPEACLLELVAALSQRRELRLDFSSIPTTYPYRGALDFSHDTMHALFLYGQRYAESGRVWTTVEGAIERGHRIASSGAIQNQDCPAD